MSTLASLIRHFILSCNKVEISLSFVIISCFIMSSKYYFAYSLRNL
nr:MAG TPA: hypothetical protein [Caudoviricetes sp.]